MDTLSPAAKRLRDDLAELLARIAAAQPRDQGPDVFLGALLLEAASVATSLQLTEEAFLANARDAWRMDSPRFRARTDERNAECPSGLVAPKE